MRLVTMFTGVLRSVFLRGRGTKALASVGVKKIWIYISTPPYAFMA
jgi:hypothetical protein